MFIVFAIGLKVIVYTHTHEYFCKQAYSKVELRLYTQKPGVLYVLEFSMSTTGHDGFFLERNF